MSCNFTRTDGSSDENALRRIAPLDEADYDRHGGILRNIMQVLA